MNIKIGDETTRNGIRYKCIDLMFEESLDGKIVTMQEWEPIADSAKIELDTPMDLSDDDWENIRHLEKQHEADQQYDPADETLDMSLIDTTLDSDAPSPGDQTQESHQHEGARDENGMCDDTSSVNSNPTQVLETSCSTEPRSEPEPNYRATRENCPTAQHASYIFAGWLDSESSTEYESDESYDLPTKSTTKTRPKMTDDWDKYGYNDPNVAIVYSQYVRDTILAPTNTMIDIFPDTDTED